MHSYTIETHPDAHLLAVFLKEEWNGTLQTEEHTYYYMHSP